MSDENTNGVPTSFWIYSGAALFWNLIGLYSYYTFVSTPRVGNPAYTEAQQAFFAAAPTWATAAYAIAVTFGTLGCIFLLMRKNWAFPAFIISLLGVVAQNFHGFVLSNALEAFGTQALILPSIVFVVGVLLILYSRSVQSKDWYG